MSVACYTDRVMTCFLQAKKGQTQACERSGRGESRLGAAAGPGLRTPVRWISRRVVAGGLGWRPRPFEASKVRWHCSARRARGQKAKDLHSNLLAFLRFRGVAVRKRQPATNEAGTAIPDSGHSRAQHGQNPGIMQNRA